MLRILESMKVNQAHPIIMWLFVIFYTAITLTLLSLYPAQTRYVFMFNWAALLIAVIYIITPLGSKRLSAPNDTSKRYNTLQWWLRIVVMELSLFFLMMGISWLIQPSAYIQSLHQQLTNFGLFPWSWICIIAIAFGLCGYHKQQDTYMHNLAIPKHAHNQTFVSCINSAVKITTFSAWCITLLLVCIIWAKIFIPEPFILAHGFNLATILTTLILFFFSFTKLFKKALKKICAFKNPTPLSITICCIGISLLLIIFSMLFSGLHTSHIKISSFIQYYMNKNPQILWHIFSLSWWFSWSYLAGIYIARISKGYSIRMMLIATLSLPVVIAILLSFTHNNSFMTSYIPVICATLGFIGILLLFTNKSFLPSTVMTFLPYADRPRHRDHHFLFRKWFQVAFIVAYFFLAINLPALYLIVFGMALPGILLIPFVLTRIFSSSK